MFCALSGHPSASSYSLTDLLDFDLVREGCEGLLFTFESVVSVDCVTFEICEDIDCDSVSLGFLEVSDDLNRHVRGCSYDLSAFASLDEVCSCKAVDPERLAKGIVEELNREYLYGQRVASWNVCDCHLTTSLVELC